MDVLHQNYILKGLVRRKSHHFTVAITAATQWVYIDDMCVSVKTYTSFQDIYIIILVVGFNFAIFRKSSVRVGNDKTHTHYRFCSQSNSDTN